MTSVVTRDYIVILPAYNEVSSIGASLEMLEKASKSTTHKLKKIIVCINGCTDDTEKVVKRYVKSLPIKIIYSAPGYVHAMNRLIKYAQQYYPTTTLVKVDADSQINLMALQRMIDQFDLDQQLVLVGGHPLPRISSSLSLYEQTLARIFSLRSIYPLAQVAKADVSMYHQICNIHPQPGIGENELRLKTYFHGRLWSVRTSGHIAHLSDGVLGDDVYLTVWLYKKFGPGAIRVIYNANTYSPPNHSLKRHWMVYKRIHEDKRRTVMLPEYTELQNMQQTRLDWSYIARYVPINDFLLFIVYALICLCEELSFEHVSYKEKYWQYKEKEV